MDRSSTNQKAHRFQPEHVALLTEASVRPCMDRLDAFMDSFLPHFYRTEHRRHACTIVKGLLSDLKRKTVEPIAIDHNQHRRALQRFVGAGCWDDDDVLGELRRQVAREFGDPSGVLIIDPTAFAKKGTGSVGVGRQWCGRLGKVDNCQLGVFLGYASSSGAALVDRRLYLPKAWTEDRARMTAAHVPKSVEFQTAGQIAVELLERSSAVLPHSWVLADDEFGRATWFRAKVAEIGERYLFDVPSNTRIRVLEPESTEFMHVSKWAGSQPQSGWTTFEVADGHKGPIAIEAIAVPVETRADDRVFGKETLLVTRPKGSKDDWKYRLAPASAAELPLAELVRAGGMRHRVEELFEEGKGDAGLAHCEVRSWVGWHHHTTLSMLAHFFLTLERKRLEKKDARDHGVAVGADHRRETA